MKRICSLAVISALLIGGGLAVYHFSGARGEVAKKKILKKLDALLGETEVARTEIERSIKGMDESVSKLTDSRIRARVQADMLSKEVNSNKKSIEESKVALTKLKTDLSAFDSNPTYTVSYGSKTYSKKDDLEKMAGKVIEHHKTLVAQNESMEKRLATYEMTASTLEAREGEAKKKLAEMKNKLKELDAKMDLVKAQREAAEALSENDKTFAENVAVIDEKIKNLDVQTETASRKEEEKWKEISAKAEVEDATKIIKDSKSTVSEIDSLLGNK